MTRPPVDGARGSLRRLLRDAVRLDRSQSDPAVAARNAVGIAAPLAVGAVTGNAAWGLAATVGALQCAFADRPGPYRLRMLRMLATAFAAAVTSALAVLASRSDAASVALVLVLAFGAGLLLAGGPSAAQVGTAGTVAALVIGHTPQPPVVAVHVGLLVLAGGAAQAALAIAAWPLRRHRPERLALAGLYRTLAAAARTARDPGVGPPAGDALTAVRGVLYGVGHDHGPSVEAYRVLLDEAERIRREIVVVGAAAERLADEREPILARLVRAALAEAGGVLDEIAAALESGRLVRTDASDSAASAVRHAVHRLMTAPGNRAGLTRRAAAARLRALAGQLRAAVDSASTGASEGGATEDRGVPARRTWHDLLAGMRANLAPDSAVRRHAIRGAALVAASDLAVRLTHVERGYWVALTILVVLRPDFGATVQRAVLRVAGSLIGLLAGTALVHWLPGGQWQQILLVLAFGFGMRLAGPANIGLSALCVSGLVVVLLELAGVPAHTTLAFRSLATLAGGALACAGVLAFPTWERDLLPQRLTALLGAYRSYLTALADPEADPKADRDRLHRARAACRVARTNAQASLDRVSAEPVAAPGAVDLGGAVLTHTHRFASAALAVDAVRAGVVACGGFPAVRGFLHQANAALGAAQRSVAGRTVPPQPAKLRGAQEELAAGLEADPDQAGGPGTAAVLVDGADRITDSLDTLLAELRRQFSGGPSPAARAA